MVHILMNRQTSFRPLPRSGDWLVGWFRSVSSPSSSLKGRQGLPKPEPREPCPWAAEASLRKSGTFMEAVKSHHLSTYVELRICMLNPRKDKEI